MREYFKKSYLMKNGLRKTIQYIEDSYKEKIFDLRCQKDIDIEIAKDMQKAINEKII